MFRIRYRIVIVLNLDLSYKRAKKNKFRLNIFI
jgi:hypothetical protein